MTESESAKHENAGPGDAEARLAALLRDLATLHDYLAGRGRHSSELARRFVENARRDPAARAYDERQAAMLEYQQYIWHEIAGRVNQMLVAYGDDPEAGVASADESPDESWDEGTRDT